MEGNLEFHILKKSIDIFNHDLKKFEKLKKHLSGDEIKEIQHSLEIASKNLDKIK